MKCKRSILCDLEIEKVKSGTAKIMEPTKHSEMKWFNLNYLPDNLTIPTKKAISDYKKQNFNIK